MDKLKKIIENCSDIEVKHKESFLNLQEMLKSKERIESLENRELTSLVKKAQTVMLTPCKLKKLKKQQTDIMEEFISLKKTHELEP